MSGEVDNRVVSMKFDNAAFESKLGDTLKSLDKLQKSLDFSNSRRNLDEISSSARGFSLSGITDAIEGVSGKFIALSTVAITAISNIVNRAVDAGVRIAKSLTINPVMQGFEEFETNMNSIQTILANTQSKGSTLADVNKALDELNHYSDQTIYNFSEMARNIGTFTAAGVDLKTSTMSIKGIANLAAISGSNSQQASTAMYQLSQALAAGRVSLMDWNSVVNAGMGGEIFQKALFETGKKMKTISGVPMSMTFEQWKKAGNSFRDSLQDGWITGEVLTQTLQGFTGDLSAAQLQAMGYTKQQAEELAKLGKTGKAAATEVKTFSQLMQTTKEAVSSGWMKTFQIFFGTFDESKALFTGISNGIGAFVEKSAEARNNLLQGWKNLGGRTMLINAFKDAIKGVGTIIKPIKDAFREFFPPKTAKDLIYLTRMFAAFTKSIAINKETAKDVKQIFRGVFAIFRIVRNVLEEVSNSFALAFVTIRKALGTDGGDILDFFVKIANYILGIDKKIEQGGLKAFFNKLNEYIVNPKKALDDLEKKFDSVLTRIKFFVSEFIDFKGVKDFIPDMPKLGLLDQLLERIQGRFGTISEAGERLQGIWDKVTGAFDRVSSVLDRAFEVVKTWFSELGQRIAEVIKPGDFNAAVDVVNVGILGGILLVFKRFTSTIRNMDFDFGGLKDTVSETLGNLNGKLKAMQTDLKADILLKIAAAIGIITVSLVALALLDSAALTRALAAMAVGFAQLAATMKVMDLIAEGPRGAAKLAAISTAMVLMAGAMVILAGAVKIFGTMSVEELARGIGAVTALLVGMTTATKLISTNGPGIVLAAAAMNLMASALTIMAGAVKLFAMMEPGEITKGLLAIAGALTIIVLAVNLMPVASTLAAGAAMIPLALGLTIMAGAVKLFSFMKGGDIAKGLAGIAAALGIIALTMNLMPVTLPITAAGLVILATALTGMAAVVAALSAIKTENLVKGIAAVAAILTILSVATNTMTAALPGAAAIVTVAGALVILSGIIQTLGKMDPKQLAIGLGAVAATFAVLGISAALLTPVIPTMAALGASLALLGAGFALFGAGALLMAKAFEIIAKAGAEGAKAFIEAAKVIVAAVPELIAAFVTSLAENAGEILKAGGLLIRVVGQVIVQILDTIIRLVPKIAETIGVIIDNVLKLISEKGPQFVTVGFQLLLFFLQGLEENIPKIVESAVNILVKFLDGLANNAQKIVDAATNLIITFITAIANNIQQIVDAGASLLINLLLGIANNIAKVGETVYTIIAKFIEAIGSNIIKIADAGADFIVKLIEGFGRNLQKVIDAGVNVVVKFIQGIDDNALKIINAAADMIIDFMNGIAESIRKNDKEFKAAGANIADAIIDGTIGGLGGRAGEIANKAKEIFKNAIAGVKGVLDSNSPSKVFQRIGGDMLLGAVLGLRRDSGLQNEVVTVAERIVSNFQASMDKIPESIGGMDEFNPVISPVLDLTRLASDSAGMSRFFSTNPVGVSFGQARTLATATAPDTTALDAAAAAGPTEIKFEQNNYSPKALTTNDIYRSTKSQIVLAKEALNIR